MWKWNQQLQVKMKILKCKKLNELENNQNLKDWKYTLV